jgi:hypothetical protein
MIIREYFEDGDQLQAELIKEEYDYLFDEVMQLYALRDTLVKTQRSTLDVTRQIAEKQTRMRFIDSKLYYIAVTQPHHPDITPVVKTAKAIWHTPEDEVTEVIREVYIAPCSTLHNPRRPYKKKDKPDIARIAEEIKHQTGYPGKRLRNSEAIHNGILNVETE